MTIRSVSWAPIIPPASHVAQGAKLLHHVRLLVVLGPSRPFRGLRLPEFRDDLVHGARVRFDGEVARHASQRPEPLSVPCEVKGAHGDPFPEDVLPDVQLRPGKEGVDPDMGLRPEGGVELVPQLGGLVLVVPLEVLVPRGENTLLGAGPFLVPADPEEDPLEPAFVEDLLEPLRLQRVAADEPSFRRIHPFTNRLTVPTDDKLHPPLLRHPVPVRDHHGMLVARVDVHEGKGDPSEERLAGKPQQRRRVLADRPEHGEILELPVRLPEDVDALVLQGVEGIHGYSFSVLWCKPHSFCSGFSHHHRPALGSSPGRIARVHGAHPMEGYPASWSRLYGRPRSRRNRPTCSVVHSARGFSFRIPPCAPSIST